jgi:hypothetical protein
MSSPPLLYGRWAQCTSRSTGARYFFDAARGASLWHDPALPAGWGWRRAAADAPREFVNLRDGMTVPQSFRVVFGASGIGVAPALTDKPNTGHHHLLIDAELSDEEKQFAIPNDEQHMHFGGGQTEVVLQLSPGPHTLQLAFGDLNHELHKPTPIMSEKITVNVQ